MSRVVSAIISVNFGGRIPERVKGILSLAGNPEVFETAAEIISFYGLSFIFVGANVVTNTFYTAVNDPKTSAGLAALRFTLLICEFFILPYLIGDAGLWLSFASAELICLLVGALNLKKLTGKWSAALS